MFCKECGTQISDGDKFCTKCGASVNGAMIPQQAYVPPPLGEGQSIQGRHQENGLKEKFLSMEGRLNRKPYCLRMMALGAFSGFVGGFFGGFFGRGVLNSTTASVIINCVIALVFLYPNYCLVVRRLHDLGRNETLANIVIILATLSLLLQVYVSLVGGDFLLVLLAVLSTMPIYLYLLFAKGTQGANQYGSDPLENLC